jgi:large subunit ribosomal protein L3
MTIGLVGRKIGMTRVFTESSTSVPVTVIEIKPNQVTQIKTVKIDGYSAVQVTTGASSRSRMNKASSGHFAKSGAKLPGRGLWEFRNPSSKKINNGDTISINQFFQGQKIDVTGKSKGKGFQGGIKRWNFSMQDATHGNSLSHRSLGSIGQCQTPGRVWKGKKMAGHMGNKRTTTQSLEVVRVDTVRELLLVKGAVPGYQGGDVIVTPAIKSRLRGV